MRIGDLKGKKIGICVSGGLDSKAVTTRLIEAELDVVGFTADLAQPDEEDIQDIPRRMAPAGAETRWLLEYDLDRASGDGARTTRRNARGRLFGSGAWRDRAR